MNKKAVLSQRWQRDARYISRSWAAAEIWPFEIIQDGGHGGGRHLEFVRIENSAISAVPENPTLEILTTWRWPPSWICSNSKYSAVRSAVHENPTLEPNVKWIGSPVAEIWSFAYVGNISDGTIRKSDGIVSYRLSIVTVALSVIIRPQFAIECLRRSNQHGVGYFGPKFRVFPGAARPVMLGLQRANVPG